MQVAFPIAISTVYRVLSANGLSSSPNLKGDSMTKERELERLRRELAEAKKKVSQYRNHEKIILNKARDRERRNRTRRLIEHGAILENVFPVRDMDAGELTALLTEISLLPVVSKMLETYKKDGERRT